MQFGTQVCVFPSEVNSIELSVTRPGALMNDAGSYN